ncbi:MAG: hypothetical protein NT033_03440, partial [Candidatus Omnitrophica bacterium]|nr:hypothetical protein [Candidatus Omnitrophota bacterium]
SKTCKVLEPSQDDSPFFQPISVDTSKLACSKINFARAIQSKGVTVNPHYKYVVCEWPWVRSYLGDDFICANAIDIRDKTFNLLFNENYGQKEIAFIKNAICKTENKYLKF